MNWLDLVILLVIGMSAVLGLKMGVIRAALTGLGIVVGSVLGGQLSDDIGGMLGLADSSGAVAGVISYAIIISVCVAIAGVTSGILLKVVNALFMGWADKLAGVALGLAGGGVIAAAIVMGMAYLTYSPNAADNLPANALNSTLDTEQVRARLDDGLTQSKLVGAFINVVEVVPASTMWFVPSNFKSALDGVDLG